MFSICCKVTFHAMLIILIFYILFQIKIFGYLYCLLLVLFKMITHVEFVYEIFFYVVVRASRIKSSSGAHVHSSARCADWTNDLQTSAGLLI